MRRRNGANFDIGSVCPDALASPHSVDRSPSSEAQH